MPAEPTNRSHEQNASVAERLRKLGVRGVLVHMAEHDQILELACEMPTCYCPKGTRHFEYRPPTTPFPDWAPNADHHPTLKMDGGHLDPWNVRLAHVRCNNEDYAWRSRIRRMLKKNKTMSFAQIADALNKKEVRPPPGTNTWAARTVRKAYVS